MWYHLFVIELRQYIDRSGRSPFERWFGQLNQHARARVSVALARVRNGNLSIAKGVGAGVYELRLDFGPGYRVYFGEDGETLVILLGGGTKKRQQTDIQRAQSLWQEYKDQKREE